jgi:drug/metabolite transporter (DMT)-like permease
MSTASGLMVSAFAALAAACAFGVAAALQHQQAGLAPRGRTLSPRLLLDVARRPLWLAGLALATAGYGLQALALAYGPLTLVAPIVAADLLFALPLAARWSRRPLRPRDWGGCLLVATGVAVFLAVSPPPSDRPDVPATDWFLVFGAVAVITGLSVAAARITGKAGRARLFAGAAGVVFGLTAAVTASFARSLRQDGLGSIFGHWEPWVLIWLGITGILLSTGAFQASALSSSLPIIDTVEPVSGVLIGAVIFDERLATSFSGLLVQFCAAGVAVAGIALLGPSLAALQPARRTRPAATRRASRAAHSDQAVRSARSARAARAAQATRPVPAARPAPARCDLLETGRHTATTEDCADQLRLLPC